MFTVQFLDFAVLCFQPVVSEYALLLCVLRGQQPISLTFSNFLIEARVNQKLGLFLLPLFALIFFFFCCVGESGNTPPPPLGLAASTLPPDPGTAAATAESTNGISEHPCAIAFCDHCPSLLLPSLCLSKHFYS